MKILANCRGSHLFRVKLKKIGNLTELQKRADHADWGGVKNPKVGKVKTGKQIIYHVTAPMSGQFLKSRSDRSSLAKSA